MAKPSGGNHPDRNGALSDPYEPLEALVRLIARQVAREDFAASARQGQANDRPYSTGTGSTTDD